MHHSIRGNSLRNGFERLDVKSIDGEDLYFYFANDEVNSLNIAAAK